MQSCQQTHSEASSSFSLTYIYLFGAPLLWSLAGVLIKSIEWNSIAIAGVRSGIASLVILPFVQGRLNLCFTFLNFAAACALAVSMFCFVAALKITNTANVAFLGSSSFIHVALLGSIFLREELSFFDWAIIVTVFIGILLFFVDDLTLGQMNGNLLALGSAFSFSICAILLRLQKNQDPIQPVFLSHLIVFLITLPYLFSVGQPQGSGWSGLLFSGVFQVGFAYICFARAIARVRAFDFTIVSMLEPILNPTWTFFVLGEYPTFWAMVGGAIILAAVFTKAFVLRVKN